jgi:flavin reductase (DIM6/NTAB) family NADH-FMN oxidoreductase RutF
LWYFVFPPMPLTKSEFRKAMGQFATGVTVVTVLREPGQIHGMTANSFTSVSLEPLLVLVCVDHRAQTLPLIHDQKQFGINVLAHNQEPLAEYFAQPGQSEPDARRLGVAFRFTERGTPLLEGCLVQLDCALVSSHVAGDHTVFLAEVESAELHSGSPLLFHGGRYRRLPPEPL